MGIKRSKVKLINIRTILIETEAAFTNYREFHVWHKPELLIFRSCL